jgi:phosphoenolpyruvate---glycerone phosphotransferase subunit DhaL
MALSPEQVCRMLLSVADAIIAAEPQLSQADRDLGDGDHGLGMQRGMEAVKLKLHALTQPYSLEQVLNTTGMAMMSSMGGASGALFGTLFRAGGKALSGHATLGSAELAQFLSAAAAAVMQRGGAKPGDKTLLDSLVPAAEKALESQTLPFTEALNAAAAAAEAGLEASKQMIAQFGRAKTLGPACLGFPDAGAMSICIILRTLANQAGQQPA